jgi:phosphatidylglycerophosphate synthase
VRVAAGNAAIAMPREVDAERARKKVKTLFGWLFFRRISYPLALWLARHTPVRPSHVTAFGLACGLAGAALIATGSYRAGVAGGLLFVVAKLMDAVDGELARATHTDTPAGYVADGLTDRVRDTAVLLGLGVGAMRSGHPDDALAWTLAAVTGYLFFFYVSGAAPSHWREVRSEADLDEKHMFRVGGGIRLGAGDTLAVAVLAVALAGEPLWLVIAVAVLAPFAIAFKVRRMFKLRPWERGSDVG